MVVEISHQGWPGRLSLFQIHSSAKFTYFILIEFFILHMKLFLVFSKAVKILNAISNSHIFYTRSQVFISLSMKRNIFWDYVTLCSWKFTHVKCKLTVSIKQRSICHLLLPHYQLILLFDPQGGGSMSLRNVIELLPKYAAPHTRSYYSSHSE